jgi:hypothetical protein
MQIKPRGGSWQVSGTIEGKRIRRQFPTKTEAEQYLASFANPPQRRARPRHAPPQAKASQKSSAGSTGKDRRSSAASSQSPARRSPARSRRLTSQRLL